ncbi:hypothetical protein RQM59_09795 [Flavobacteriaceae bacterium S356]|uniref:Membrane or secreted protein n=1 Tax=Asprobacillus argus TaxID=3076534 RepID=A0ABU3LG12_9FLAO|nr:hypothetical protein [Flavobacteriaceae bacterium S356]
MKKISKKGAILFALFIFPLAFFLLLSTGINNFNKLPVVTSNVKNVVKIDPSRTLELKGKISIVCFLGYDVDKVKGSFFNLNQKIYKPFYGFKDFQIVAIYPKESQLQVDKLKSDLGDFTNMVKWNFVAANDDQIDSLYQSLQTTYSLDPMKYSSRAFIIDKDLNLRGRNDDEDFEDGMLFGYNMQSVAELNNKMKDDVKVVLAEYRLALKKNKRNRKI